MPHLKVTLYLRITTAEGKRKMCKPLYASRGRLSKSRSSFNFFFVIIEARSPDLGISLVVNQATLQLGMDCMNSRVLDL